MKNKLKTIVNIPFIVCLTILLFNDFYLKAEYHNWLTGKLSDFCGLVVWVQLWTAIFPNKKLAIYFFTALLFVIWKSPYSQVFINFFSQSLYPIRRVVDITDLVALTVLPIIFFYKTDFSERLKINPIPLALLAIFSFCATSIPQPTQVFEQPQYILFKSGITQFENDNYFNQYRVYNFDTLLIIDIKRIRIEKRAPIDDEFHKVQILKDLDLRLIRCVKNGDKAPTNLTEYENLRDSLTKKGVTSITLKLDSITDELNFRNTRLHGDFKRYSNDRQLLIDGRYKNGIEDSIWVFNNIKDETFIRKYFEKGELTKTELCKTSKIISEQKLNTREETVRNKCFQLAIMLILILALLKKLYDNFKTTNNKKVIKVSNLVAIGGSLILPLIVLILAKLFSSIIPNSFQFFFLSIIFEAMVGYIIMAPLFLLIFYDLKLRTKFDLTYYVLLFSLLIVLAEESFYLKSLM